MFKRKTFIKQIKANEILDSRGNPTIEVSVELNSGEVGIASVPSGASTGKYEALELRDNDKKRFNGKGVLKAVANVNKKINFLLKNKDANNQKEIDFIMIENDGTQNKSKFGANAILGVSLACAKAVAKTKKIPLYKYIANIIGISEKDLKMPIPSFNVINGGKHADNNVDFQEFMLFPSGVKTFCKKIRAGSEIFYELKNVLLKNGLSTGVGDEGGFAPKLSNNKEALDLIITAVQNTKYKIGKDIFIAMDPASSEFYKNKKYVLKGEGKEELKLNTDEMILYWSNLCEQYPIISIEDPLAEDDWAGWTKITKLLGNKIQIVGDDLLVTNPKRIQNAIIKKASNTVLIKLNQIGTLTETLQAIQLAKQNNFKIMISHRSGETTDTFIADLAVGSGADQIKSGSLSRGERICKYNRLMEIERELLLVTV